MAVWGGRRSRRRHSYVNATAHKVDGAVTPDQINRLSAIYRRILEPDFADLPCRA